MVQTTSKNIVETWLHQDAATLLKWIDVEPSPTDDLIFGLSVLDGLIIKVDHLLSQEENQLCLQWATVTIKLYDRLLPHISSTLQITVATKIMMLRIRLMKALGVQSHSSILDPETIVQWFQKTCNLSLAETEAMAQEWKNQPVEKIRQLRQLKNQLQILVQLSQIPHILSSYPELMPWLNLKSQLP
ncbi:MAG: hypothetical protein ACO3NK_09870 [Prochlorotrichaceae cyanobacterium]